MKMFEKILVLDMGGTSIKAGLIRVDGGQIEEDDEWRHEYQASDLEDAKSDLVSKIRSNVCRERETANAVGIAIAGLVADNNSLYRSTVLTSFQGFNLPNFLKKEFEAKVATIDNDADCGAICEWHLRRKNLLYVVVGSGIGSAYIDNKGNLPYLTRFDLKHQFSDKDNPVPNDLGLQLAIPKEEVYKEFGESSEVLDRLLVDSKGSQLRGPGNDSKSIRLGDIASGTGLKRIIDMELFAYSWRNPTQATNVNLHYRKFPLIKDALKMDKTALDEKRIAMYLSHTARYKDKFAVRAFEIFGHFLGYGIAETQKIIREEQNLDELPDTFIGGAITRSYHFFRQPMMEAIAARGGNDYVRLSYGRDLSEQRSKHFALMDSVDDHSNLHGAFVQAYKALLQSEENHRLIFENEWREFDPLAEHMWKPLRIR